MFDAKRFVECTRAPQRVVHFRVAWTVAAAVSTYCRLETTAATTSSSLITLGREISAPWRSEEQQTLLTLSRATRGIQLNCYTTTTSECACARRKAKRKGFFVVQSKTGSIQLTRACVCVRVRVCTIFTVVDVKDLHFGPLL